MKSWQSRLYNSIYNMMSDITRIHMVYFYQIKEYLHTASAYFFSTQPDVTLTTLFSRSFHELLLT